MFHRVKNGKINMCRTSMKRISPKMSSIISRDVTILCPPTCKTWVISPNRRKKLHLTTWICFIRKRYLREKWDEKAESHYSFPLCRSDDFFVGCPSFFSSLAPKLWNVIKKNFLCKFSLRLGEIALIINGLATE